MTLAKVKNLYNQDFALWIEATVKQLKSGDLSQVDLENLIEEVESLGKSQRKAVDNFLTRLLEHLLKRCYVVLPDCYRGWEIEIRNFRKELKKEFKYSPSLKRFMIEILEECYREALEAVKEDYPDSNFPDVCPFAEDIDGLLNHKFWEYEK
ncbi:MAG: DUF29 domain-containing protein [Microcystis sp. M53603_WE2]|uniref:DUF29 domain-containing protein n=1 Tax=unclassified Microcystis TaxID=2643300 RepID=UPI0022CC7E82|nr:MULTISPECIES: DUF29 domain-containing protein [unclassified Microcystis]MCE2663002.1 DUF29 domain-containing protein [Microcystis sp. 53602_E8]MCZ8364392.1 DUF29 domain-containing protein [Microcystis sp. LE19-251.1A]MDJ0530045.1 DUF29 domain-containing protein [Microcystis sp. M53600_WE12]MCZ8027415.1 DUF29 domain-containing protein [Microcystis sp. LE19-10.1B]MDJ0537508.1 DUF29 domain-containing protein [Microcystis sp. M53603_WE2]